MKSNKSWQLIVLSFALLMLLSCEASYKSGAEHENMSPTASLTNTYWKLIELNSEPVVMPQNQARESHMVLHSENQRLAGFGMCNHFFGKFVELEQSLGKGTLQFNTIGATQMACPDLNHNEQAFFEVFAKKGMYKIDGETLILSDRNNEIVAKFSAVYF